MHRFFRTKSRQHRHAYRRAALAAKPHLVNPMAAQAHSFWRVNTAGMDGAHHKGKQELDWADVQQESPEEFLKVPENRGHHHKAARAPYTTVNADRVDFGTEQQQVDADLDKFATTADDDAPVAAPIGLMQLSGGDEPGFAELGRVH